MKNHLGILSFSLFHKAFEGIEAVIIELVAPGLGRSAMRQYLIVERIQKKRPFPVCTPDLENSHVGDNDLKRGAGIPAAFDSVGKQNALFARPLIRALSAFEQIPAALQHLCAKLWENIHPVCSNTSYAKR